MTNTPNIIQIWMLILCTPDCAPFITFALSDLKERALEKSSPLLVRDNFNASNIVSWSFRLLVRFSLFRVIIKTIILILVVDLCGHECNYNLHLGSHLCKDRSYTIM